MLFSRSSRALAALSLVLGFLLTAHSAIAQDMTDVRQLPRLDGAILKFQGSPFTYPYNVKEPVPVAAQRVVAILTADGWQAFIHPTTKLNLPRDVAIHQMKRGGHLIEINVSVVKDENNETRVLYEAKPLANDLPFPKDGVDIRFDPTAPLLIAKSPSRVEDLVTYYRHALGDLQWSEQNGGEAHKTVAAKGGARLFFTHQKSEPLSLTLLADADGSTRVELKSIPPSTMAAAQAGRATDTQRVGSGRSTTKPEGDPEDTKFDVLAQSLIKEALQGARPGAKPAERPAAPAPAAGAPALKPLAGQDAPIPLPETAIDVAVDGEQGSVEYTSPSAVADIAAFYRALMSKGGWKPETSVINNERMVVLNYSRNRKRVSLTILKFGEQTKVTARGDALITAAAKAEPAARPASRDPRPATGGAPADDPSVEQIAEEKLEVADSGGLPVPKPHTSVGREKSLFRYQASASVPASIDAIVGFYRRELGKRDWKEVTQSAAISKDKASIRFTTPEGPAQLTLARRSGYTDIQLLVRKEAEARQSGLLPKPGQVRIMFGNVLDGEATVLIGGRTVKVKPNVGSKKPDGPSIEVPPGNLKYTIKAKGVPAAGEEMTVAADEIWGLIIGPGGGLPLPMY